MPKLHIGLNPLPWVLTPSGFDLTKPILRAAFTEIATTPFKGIHADPPPGLDASSYRALLAEYDLEPALGYFSVDVDSTDLVESARRGDIDLLAAVHALPDTFDGWLVVEVDVPEADTNLTSTQFSAQWVTDHLGADTF